MYEDSLTISLLPELDATIVPKEEPLYEICDRKKKAICDEEWSDCNGNIIAYVNRCNNRFFTELGYGYDVREDDRLKDDDIIDHCFVCGKPVTKADVLCIDAISYTWDKKDGTIVSPHCCWNNPNCKAENGDNPFGCEDAGFHEHYLRITGFTDEEYIQKMKKESPSVFAARVKAGMYDEAGNRLPPPEKKRGRR